MYRHGTDVAFRVKEPLLRDPQPSPPRAFYSVDVHSSASPPGQYDAPDCSTGGIVGNTRETSCHSGRNSWRGEKISGIILKNLIFLLVRPFPYFYFFFVRNSRREREYFDIFFFFFDFLKLELELEINLISNVRFERSRDFTGGGIICTRFINKLFIKKCVVERVSIRCQRSFG